MIIAILQGLAIGGCVGSVVAAVFIAAGGWSK